MRVPQAEQHVSIEGLPGARQNIQVNPSNFLGATAKAGLDFAQGIGEGANKLAIDYHNQQLEENRRIQAIGANNQLNEYDIKAQNNPQTGWRNQLGDQVLKQENSLPLPVNVMDARKQKINELADAIPDPMAKQMFIEHADQSGQNVLARVSGHEAEQIQNYKVSTLEGGISTATQSLVANYNDSKAFDEGLHNIAAYSDQLGAITGKGSDWAKAKALGHISDAIQGSAGLALQNGDYHTAQGLLDKYGHLMTPQDKANVQNNIGDSYGAALSQSDPQALKDATQHKLAGNFPDMKFEQVKALRDSIESNGVDFNPDGTDLVHIDKDGVASRFKNQVRDDVAANPGFGIKPAASRTPAEYNRVGDQLLKAHYDFFGGDVEKALRAYNGGRGGMDNADAYIAKARAKANTTNSPLDGMTNQDLLKWNIKAESELRQKQASNLVELKTTIDNQYATAANTGKADNMLSFGHFSAAYGDKAQQAYAEYQDQIAHAKQYFAIKDLPLDQAAALLESSKPTSEDHADREWQQHNELVKQFQHAQEQRQKDPGAIQERLGFSQPLQGGLTQNIDNIAARTASAYEVKNKYGTEFKMLSNATATQFQSEYKQMPADQQAQTVGSLAGKLHDKNALFSVINQIAPDSPPTIMAAMMMQYPGQNETASKILQGVDLLNRNKKEDGKPASLPIPSDTAITKAFLDQVGTAYVGTGQDSARRLSDQVQAVRALYAVNAFQTGKLSTDKNADAYNPELMKDAIDKVTGGVAVVNGKEAYIPWGMTQDDFENQAPRKIQQALDDAGLGKTNWKSYGLAALGDGYYQLHNSGRAMPVFLQFKPSIKESSWLEKHAPNDMGWVN